MNIKQYCYIALLGATNGIGLGAALECSRQLHNLKEKCQGIFDASGQVSNITTYDPLHWYAIPIIASLCTCIISVAVILILPLMLKNVLWYWLFVGVTSYIVGGVLIIAFSSHELLTISDHYWQFFHIFEIVIIYDTLFGLAIMVAKRVNVYDTPQN